MLIPYGWGDKLKKDVPMGMMACGTCNGFTMYHLGRVVFRIHICYIPIFFKTKGYYIFCENCSRGTQITKEQYNIMKPAFQMFSNKKELRECFNMAMTLSRGLEPTQQNIDMVFNNLVQNYPIGNEMLASQYKDTIADIMRLSAPANAAIENNG